MSNAQSLPEMTKDIIGAMSELKMATEAHAQARSAELNASNRVSRAKDAVFTLQKKMNECIEREARP